MRRVHAGKGRISRELPEIAIHYILAAHTDEDCLDIIARFVQLQKLESVESERRIGWFSLIPMRGAKILGLPCKMARRREGLVGCAVSAIGMETLCFLDAFGFSNHMYMCLPIYHVSGRETLCQFGVATYMNRVPLPLAMIYFMLKWFARCSS